MNLIELVLRFPSLLEKNESDRVGSKDILLYLVLQVDEVSSSGLGFLSNLLGVPYPT